MINSKAKPVKPNPEGMPVCKGQSCKLIEEGTRVRIPYDEPREFLTGERQPGHFRVGDIRWQPKIWTVKKIILKPNTPPLYVIDENKKVAYTRNQLQIVPENEKYPSHHVIKHPEKLEKFKIQKIIDKKKEHGRIFYKIRWLGYDEADDTWESRSSLIKDVPTLIKQFDANHKIGGSNSYYNHLNYLFV
jgi:hypothetical protein